MKKKLIFTVALLLYVFVLIVAASMVLSKVKGLLVEYEASQPEKTVELEVKAMVQAAKNGSLGEMLKMPEGYTGTFDESSPLVKPYVELVAAGNLTYKQLSGLGEDEATDGTSVRYYGIYSGDTQIAKLRITGTNERTKLLVFTCLDWESDTIEPTVYNCSMTLPKGLTVSVGGKSVEGTPTDDGKISYSVSSLMKIENVTVSDEFGHTLNVDESNMDSIALKTFKITIPSSYTLTVGGKTISKDGYTKTDMPGFDILKKYISEVPYTVSYEVSCLVESGETPEVKITDNLGGNVDMDYASGYLEITDLVKSDSLPDEISNEIDVLKCVETWSLFMTDDLSGTNHGFSKFAKYLIKDTTMYNYFSEWGKNVDITFTSAHTLLNPTFVDESVSGYIRYTEDCFSCDVKLTERMKLTRTGEIKESTINATLYFVKYDDTDDGKDNPRWLLATYKDNTASSAKGE